MNDTPTAGYAIKAWPDAGFAEMTVEVFDNRPAAAAEAARLAERYPRWRFRIVEVVPAS